jgi:hemolysin activation/secretion protein
MARLGGFSSFPQTSQPLRGYDYNRFTDNSAVLLNLEYRYNIWQFREFKLDTVVFADEGQVFNRISQFQFKNFRESYGLGFRLNLANIPLLSVEIAHGDEGTNFYVKSKAPF